MNKVFVTGSCGFIGFHLSKILLEDGFEVFGYDGITDYYDVDLKISRNNILKNYKKYKFVQGMLEDHELLSSSVKKFQPDSIVHLAAQAGVRYSLENPRSYIDTNVIGTFNVMECAREINIDHLLIASTSSVYGANVEMPFSENDKTETPLTIYAASKKANELMTHSYSNLWQIPTTAFRFFTVYGPWGRPDMALFKFTDRIYKNKSIDVYRNGEMYRDFTYVEDLVKSIKYLIHEPPRKLGDRKKLFKNDSLSPVAPFRTVNIGNSNKVKLLDLIEILESCLKMKANKNFMPIQPGDVESTWANSDLLYSLIQYRPDTKIEDGIKSFVSWYQEFYNK